MVPEFARKIEQAGKGYAQMQHLREFGPKVEEIPVAADEEKKSGSADDEGFEDDDGPEDKEYARKTTKRTKEQIDEDALHMDNYYELLGLDDKIMDTSDNKIAKAYRKKALQYHPDKLGKDPSE
jgi:preprotein translocase subunit Sec63